MCYSKECVCERVQVSISRTSVIINEEVCMCSRKWSVHDLESEDLMYICKINQKAKIQNAAA